jgi:hypothetical protein
MPSEDDFANPALEKLLNTCSVHIEIEIDRCKTVNEWQRDRICSFSLLEISLNHDEEKMHVEVRVRIQANPKATGAENRTLPVAAKGKTRTNVSSIAGTHLSK